MPLLGRIAGLTRAMLCHALVAVDRFCPDPWDDEFVGVEDEDDPTMPSVLNVWDQMRDIVELVMYDVLGKYQGLHGTYSLTEDTLVDEDGDEIVGFRLAISVLPESGTNVIGSVMQMAGPVSVTCPDFLNGFSSAIEAILSNWEFASLMCSSEMEPQ